MAYYFIFYVVEYPAAAKRSLAVPIPVVSFATTPTFDTKLTIDTFVLVKPYPNIALSVPYPAAAKEYLAVPTPVVSVATTPALLTKFVIDTCVLV